MTQFASGAWNSQNTSKHHHQIFFIITPSNITIIDEQNFDVIIITLYHHIKSFFDNPTHLHNHNVFIAKWHNLPAEHETVIVINIIASKPLHYHPHYYIIKYHIVKTSQLLTNKIWCHYFQDTSKIEVALIRASSKASSLSSTLLHQKISHRQNITIIDEQNLMSSWWRFL